MKSVLIIDDEDKVCTLIKKIIDWQGLKLTLLDTIYNGADALMRIEQDRPDIVISDIRMPGMGGLEIIERCQRKGIDSKFIIISGYKFFDYALQALKFGVEDYLVKPISQMEMNGTLKKILNKLDGESLILSGYPLRLSGQSKAILGCEFYKEIAKRPDNPNLEEINNHYNMNLQPGNFQSFMVKLDYDFDGPDEQNQMGVITEKVIEYLENHFKDFTQDIIFGYGSESLIKCLVNTQSPSLLVNYLPGIFNGLQKIMDAYDGFFITLAIGRESESLAGAAESISSALEALEYRIVVGIGKIIVADDYEFEKTKGVEEIALPYKNSFSQAVAEANYPEIRSIIHSMYSDSFSTGGSPSIYYRLATYLTHVFFTLHPWADENFISQKDRIIHRIPDLYTVENMQRFLADRFCSFLEDYFQNQTAMLEKPLRAAEEYIKRHYSEKITLEDVADVVERNPVYLSSLFKSKTGKNFIDYVTETRIEAAKKILLETYDPVRIVASRVGYKDARYFSQLFMKSVGIKPSIYRKLFS